MRLHYTGVGTGVIWPASLALADVLDAAVGVVGFCGLDQSVLNGIGIAAGDITRHRQDPSADLLRAFDAADSARAATGVGLSLLISQVRSVDSVVEGERSLRAAGNRLPIRVCLPGIAPSPFRRTAMTLLGLAEAAEKDPASLLADVHFALRESPAGTSEFAD